MTSLLNQGSNSVQTPEYLGTYGDLSIPFLDTSYSLYLFIDRLYKAAIKDGVVDLCFFAREGQPLKQMFDSYQACQDNSEAIRTHYLKVSRRSTFLMSLGPLGEESFSVLFRQYRSISISDFLKSLDLNEYAKPLACALGVDEAAFAIISDDLPTAPLFLKLCQHELFFQIYEGQRVARSIAFESYLKGLLGTNDLSHELHVVDVGWKGSIQDNLYHWLRGVHGDGAKIQGYYLGLVATGSISFQNCKKGLLFSNVDGITPGFHIFNENRSLFEIILHADHGSACRYVLDAQGRSSVVEDEFHEGEMITEKVHVISQPIMDLFQKIVVATVRESPTERKLLETTLKRHYRMVYHPTKAEIEWVSSVSHVENFGVFEESKFGDFEIPPSLWSKIRFTWRLVRRSRPSELGNWPWLTIRKRALPGLSFFYSLIRRWQSRR